MVHCHTIVVVLNYCLPTHFGPDSALYIPLFDCLSPEYNHTIPLALSSLLAYFGGGSYIVKTGYARVIKLSIHSVYVLLCPRQGLVTTFTHNMMMFYHTLFGFNNVHYSGGGLSPTHLVLVHSLGCVLPWQYHSCVTNLDVYR